MLLWESLVETYFFIALLKACWKTSYTTFRGTSFIHMLLGLHSNSVVHDFSLQKPHWRFPNRLCLFTFSKMSLFYILPFYEPWKSDSACSSPQSPFCEKEQTGNYTGNLPVLRRCGCSQQSGRSLGQPLCNFIFEFQVNATWPSDLLTTNTSIWSNTFCICTQTHLVHLTPTLLTKKNGSGVETSLMSSMAKSNERN